ncbi:MAG: tRNA isopentenyl-2-thiomethyl-A-37 hydroxylase MiaE [Porticoccaceae bacterium]|jgi:tRNA-(ms[2]io[6]A)-hydroxylase|nr:tRNA isopentenyl-2-thiomethyl-A-37 hydroxylase MiaE [Porticoccaceae bacterium]MEA3301256.1 tRNA isopentenyl-2-thiomethyl-A-37 hydroxylase MiaE [Pseudomonadota bacterium]HLS97225.1 tRNA isopentenyl-2-thiomethyl-A-37 hydroxylase MiaE [Porticoccaceae bacterium]
MTQSALDEILAFLPCATPDAWLAAALDNQPLLLIDHANCEKKAASTALSLMYRYVDDLELLHLMSRLAREELRHFEQVLDIMAARGIAYGQVSASRYAAGLRDRVRPAEPHRLVDTLIVGAFIEARSCERFARLAPLLDAELGKFYTSLLKSEGRHYRDYLGLAKAAAGGDISDRIAAIAARERELIEAPDPEFRFHSGIPLSA